jgi:hypothetical protein
MSAVNIVQLDRDSGLDLYQRLAALPAVDFKSASIEESDYGTCIHDAKRYLTFQDLQKRAQHDLFEREDCGYIVIEGLFPCDSENINEKLKLPTAICGLIGKPLKVMDKLGLWLDVPVKLEVESYRFGGTGYNPFHIDVVNAFTPPDIVVLLSERVDPLNGGTSLVANLRKALADLSIEEIQLLKEPIFGDGKLSNMSHVGNDCNPFAVLSEGWIRYSAKMLFNMPESPHKKALERMEKALIANQEQILLAPGQAILMNQRIVAHGRFPLGASQETVDPAKRRLLHQLYLRRYSN